MKSLFALLLPVLALAAQSCHQTENTDRLHKFEAQVDSIFSGFDNSGPGLAVAVFQDDQVVLSKGYGLADLDQGTAITPESVFDIASVSKQFTAYAAARLMEEGRLSMDDDLSRFFPELQGLPATLKVHHLVYHTSGLRDWPQTMAIAGWDMEGVLSYEQILDMAFRQTALNYLPGEEYSYTNTGYVLLAELISRVSGQPFEDYVSDVIFTPLGMQQSFFSYNIHEVVPGRVQSYYAEPRGTFELQGNKTTAMGSSSMHSTAADIARWLLYLSENMESDAAVKRMHRQGVLNNGDTITYAYGVWLEPFGGLPAVIHTGSWAGFRAITVRFPAERTGLVILSNLGNFDRYAFAGAVARAYLGDRFAMQDDAPVVLDGQLPDELAGVYLSDPARIYEVDMAGGELMVRIDSDITHTLVAEGDNIFRSVDDATLAMTIAPDGLYINNGRLTRQPPASTPLQAYTGRYYSEELQMNFEVSVADGRLTFFNLHHGHIGATALAEGIFRGDAWFLGRIRFTGAGSSVDGFEVFGGRVRRLHFSKIQ